MKKSKVLKKVFKPNGEKMFVASIPFFPIIPIILYAVSNFLIGREGIVGKFFYIAGFVSYAFISLFAIPFEGMLEFFGMMEYGGGIFEIGLKSLDLGGMVLVQVIYAVIFYSIFSITSGFRGSKKMKYSLSKRS